MCVARPVTGHEQKNNPDAVGALKKEWDRLESIGTWDMKGVREWADV
jgi:hypothetical protein